MIFIGRTPRGVGEGPEPTAPHGPGPTDPDERYRSLEHTPMEPSALPLHRHRDGCEAIGSTPLSSVSTRVS